MTQGLCGPYAGLLMADSGAEVVKVEPPEGDCSRRYGPPWIGTDGAVFNVLNRNKLGVCLDGTSLAGRKILLDLVTRSDVFLVDLPGPELHQLGLDYDAVSALNPQIIYCHVTPFGDHGPMANLPGSELVLQAMSGYANSLTIPGEEPVRLGADVAASCTGVIAFTGVLAALFWRTRGGTGQKVTVSILGTLLQLREVFWAAISDPDDWQGFHCDSELRSQEYGYATRDGRIYFNVHRADEDDFALTLIDLGMEEMLADPRFAEGGRHAVGLGIHAAEVKSLWEQAFRDKSTEQVLRIFADHNGSATAINDYSMLFSNPHVQGLKNIDAITHPTAGSLTVVRPLGGIGGDSMPVTIAPSLGEHNEQVLTSFGYTREAIHGLQAEGIICCR